MILISFYFKLAVAPFHMWAPDVYQGAPAPITALIATGSKAAVFIVLLRLGMIFGIERGSHLFSLLTILAVITMFTGNLLGLLQNNVKRLLAYSSIAHIGYLLIPFLAGGVDGKAAIFFYFISYFGAMLAAFGVISILSRQGDELQNLQDYRGLGLRRPWLAAAFALSLLSLAGVPPTIGFFAKFYIFLAAAHSGLWLLLIIGLLNSGIAVYYYLRVLVTLYLAPESRLEFGSPVQLAVAIVLMLLSGIILLFGLYPSPIISFVNEIARSFAGYIPPAW
jgi:NADH-quinone oxidoreductase subunit N